jgi:hypothetical protein
MNNRMTYRTFNTGTAKVDRRWLTRLLLIWVLVVALVGVSAPALYAQEDEVEETQAPIAETSLVDDPSIYLPSPDMEYAQVPSAARVYASIDDVRTGNYYTTHGGPDVWVVTEQSEIVDGQEYYHVRWDWNNTGWMSAGAMQFTASLSRLRGVDLEGRGDEHLAMVYSSTLNVRSEPGVITPETRIDRLQRYDLVTVQDQRTVNGSVWYEIADGHWIHSNYVRDLISSSRPEGVGPDEKWIEVNLTEQTMFAHVGDTPIFGTLTATGRAGFETRPGLFRPWTKLETAPMRGAQFGLGYDLADVPYIVYFDGAIGYHGVYWHDSYGTTQSAGCINLSPHDAQWFFEWSDPPLPEGQTEVRPGGDTPGTWVYVTY